MRRRLDSDCSSPFQPAIRLSTGASARAATSEVAKIMPAVISCLSVR